MATPWSSIDSSLIATGRVWLPQLTLLFMGRDWGLVESSFDFDYPQSNVNVTTTDWSQAFDSFWLRFPEDWADDDTYGTLTTRVSVTFEGNVTAGGTSYQVRLNPTTGTIDSRNAVTVSATSYSPLSAALYVDFDGVPTGSVEFQLQVINGGSDADSFLRRQWGDAGTGYGGCDCFVKVDKA